MAAIRKTTEIKSIQTVFYKFITFLIFRFTQANVYFQTNKNMQAEKPVERKLTRSYVEEVFRQIQMQPDIIDIVILNKARNPLKSTMEMSEALQFCGLYEILQEKAQNSVKNIDPKDTMQMLRVRTKFNETIITPDDLITVMVVQNAKDKSKL